jgi:hypothetical protein
MPSSFRFFAAVIPEGPAPMTQTFFDMHHFLFQQKFMAKVGYA